MGITVPRLIPYVTALPASPADGQDVFYAADATNSVIWHLRYRSAVSRWERVGGPPLTAEVNTSQTSTTTSYVDLATVGPSITAPLAGDYLIAVGDQMLNNANASAATTAKLGSAVAVDDDGVNMNTGSTTGNMTSSRAFRRTLAASDVVKLQYKVSSGTGTFLRRELSLLPFYVT